MAERIDMRMPNGGKSAITVETLSDGNIGLGFCRTGEVAQAVRLSRTIAKRLAEAILRECQGDA